MNTHAHRHCSLRSRRSSLRTLRLSALVAAGAMLGLGACSDQNSNTDELDNILRDGDLTLLSSHALTLAAPAAGGAAGGPVTVDAGTTTGGRGGGLGGSVGSSDASVGSPDGGAAGGVGTGGKGVGGGSFDGGMGGTGGLFPQEAQGLWQFDDCNPERTELSDSNFQGHTAFRSVSTACVPGIQNQAIRVDQTSDYVYVPDQPNFTFDNGVTAAAWVNPTTLGGVRTIFRKREGGTSTFVLLTNGNEYQFVVRLANGRAAAVNARARLNVWTHVAGTYDGRDLRLYINGALAAHSRVRGQLSSGAGPLLMGNDAFGRRIDGALDNVFFDTNAATADQIVRLTCLPHPSTLVGVPAVGPMVPAGTQVSYDVQLTNNACDPQGFQFDAFAQSPDISVVPNFDFRQVEVGATEHIALTVTSTTTAEADDYPVSLFAFAFSNNSFESLSSSVIYSVQGGPCSVRSRRELSIRDLSVVEDPVRTAPGGAWTFGHLMENMAPTAAGAPAMVESLLDTWLTDQTVNGFSVPARPAMQDVVLSTFPRNPDGSLDLTQAPFRLLAIVNRIDLVDVANGSAGEGRFVFGVLDQFGNPQQITMIFEYNIPTASAQDVTDLANRWHALSSLPFPSEQYNAALQAITDGFTKRNAAPGRINGSALGQFRSNDFQLGEWEFREFHLSAATGMLAPAPTALTPDRSLNNTTALADFINANEAAILLQKHTVPATFEGQPFLAGSMITNFFVWNAAGVNPEARAKFALNTCNGCHTSPLETNTFVFQVPPRSQGQESQLSPFLLGTDVFDFQAGVIRHFNELGRRNRNLHALICPTDPLPPAPPETTPLGGVGGRGGGMGGFFGGLGDSSEAVEESAERVGRVDAAPFRLLAPVPAVPAGPVGVARYRSRCLSARLPLVALAHGGRHERSARAVPVVTDVLVPNRY